MTHLSPNASLVERIEEQLAEAGLQAAVESSDGTLILSGMVDTEEAREAAFDIVSVAAPSARVDNQIEVETILPTDVGDFAGEEPSAEMAESSADIRASGGELEPDFMHASAMTDPLAAAGFDRMKNKVMRTDAVSQAKAEMAGSDTLEDKFARLEKEDEIERLLQEMKNRQGMSA